MQMLEEDHSEPAESPWGALSFLDEAAGAHGGAGDERAEGQPHPHDHHSGVTHLHDIEQGAMNGNW